MADSSKPTTSATAAKAAKPEAHVSDEVTASHERRTSVPGASNVDARLDNRTGSDRPPLESFPAKPQQVDGPDVAHQVEHTRATLDKDALGRDVKKSDDERKGMFSPGPHGLTDDVDGRPLKADD
jgi:hypothetical protein